MKRFDLRILDQSDSKNVQQSLMEGWEPFAAVQVAQKPSPLSNELIVTTLLYFKREVEEPVVNPIRFARQE